MLELIKKIFEQKKFSGYIKVFNQKLMKIGEDKVYMIELERAQSSLGDALRIKKENKNYFNIDEVLHIFHNLARCLLLLHNSKIIHFDIKPDNVFYFDYNNTYYFSDFGGAK
jgi:serine/threonine protein kinase